VIAILGIQRLSNAEFLEAYLAGTLINGLLPIDEYFISARFAEYEERFQQLVAEKTIVAEQSGDNWHDGAFRATDSEANSLAQLVTSLNRALAFPRVGYPDESQERVTLGSRVELRNANSRPYLLDIVGVSVIYDRATKEQEVASLESPIAKAVVGKCVGDIALMQRNNRQGVEVAILSLDQTALRAMDPHEAPK